MSTPCRVVGLPLLIALLPGVTLWAQSSRQPPTVSTLPFIRSTRMKSEGELLKRGPLSDLEQMYDEILERADPSQQLIEKRIEFGKDVAELRRMMAAFQKRAVAVDAKGLELRGEYEDYKSKYKAFKELEAKLKWGRCEKVLTPPVCPKCGNVHEEDRPSPQDLSMCRRLEGQVRFEAVHMQRAAESLSLQAKHHAETARQVNNELTSLRRELASAMKATLRRSDMKNLLMVAACQRRAGDENGAQQTWRNALELRGVRSSSGLGRVPPYQTEVDSWIDKTDIRFSNYIVQSAWQQDKLRGIESAAPGKAYDMLEEQIESLLNELKVSRQLAGYWDGVHGTKTRE